MPTYDYKCKECGHQFEHFQSMTDKQLRKCPKCGRNTLQRLIGAGGGLIFKGSGFYITDYRSSEYKEKAKSESESKPTSEPTPSKSSGDSASKASPSKEGSSPSKSSGKKSTGKKSKSD